MEADWEEVQVLSHPGPGVNGLPTPVTVLAFDPSQELLWTGNQFGRVTSFFGPELQKYTSYKGHASEEVKQILFTDKGVLSVSARSIHLASRRGPAIWHTTHELFLDLRCMSFTSKGSSELLVAGCQDFIFKIDVETGTISETSNYTIMKKAGQFICAATNAGTVHFLDTSTLECVKTWQAHLGWINDMDAKADYLVTCGWSARQQHGYMLDPLANVYSLKTLQPLPPIPFQPGAAFVRMHPRMSTTCIIASQSGHLQVVDIHNHNTANLKQARIFESTFLTWLELAPSGEALALATSVAQIHLWGSPTKMQFAEYSNPTVFADPTPTPSATIDWSPDSHLNDIGMPYYRELLLSAWPPNMVIDVGALSPKIDPVILANLKRSEFGSYAPNPRTTRRYQVQDTRGNEASDDPIAAPKFLSEKAREAANTNNALSEERRISDAMESLDALKDRALEVVTKKDVPVMYRNVEIKYSKFGVDDFDFEYYNKTKFSGLETHIANSYANPLLQLYRFIPVIRNLALRHTATSCLYDSCLLCELGFLIDMLEKAAGRNCQATNFLKTFSSNSSAASLNLLEELSPNIPLTTMIQSVNRFLLDKFAADYRQLSPQARHMDQMVTTKVTATIRCAHCSHEQMRPEDPCVHDLIYPAKNAMRNTPRPLPRPTFSQILKASVERQEQTRGWCPRCKRYQQLSTRKQVQTIPAVLMINASIHGPESKQLWATPNWLPQEIGIIVENGQFFCYEGQDLRLHLQRGVYNVQVYELIGAVADINSGENQKPHLVSLIDVAPSSPSPTDMDAWHLFNDFLVRQTTRDDALRFDIGWKLPSVLAYQLSSVSHHIDDSWKSHLDTSILYRRWSPQDEHPDLIRTLSPDETPQEGTPVGIDAEFVSLQREEIEIKADGKRETIRPSRMGLARVSVLRGGGDEEEEDFGLPFIDDYIAISEPVVDYLTAYSGIHPGDLDRATSHHALVSLKIAYKKLWLLLNLGVVFVGHGLLKDFRTINIHVPKTQVVDTVDLFYLPARQRKISLRFLASLLLGEDIQTETHDSIEDARTALKLWRKFESIKADGEVEETLEWIYKTGYETGWSIGSGGTGTGTGTGTPFGRGTPEPFGRPGSRSGLFAGEGRSGTSTPVRKGVGVFKGGEMLSPPPRRIG